MEWISVFLMLHIFPMFGLHVLFHAYHFDACEQKYLGKHTYLSS